MTTNNETEFRTENLMVKMTPTEKATLSDAAKKVGLSISDFVRLLIRQWADGITFEKKKANDNGNKE